MAHLKFHEINKQYVYLLNSVDTDSISFKNFVLKAVEKASFDQVSKRELYRCNKFFIVKQVNKFMEMKSTGYEESNRC